MGNEAHEDRDRPSDSAVESAGRRVALSIARRLIDAGHVAFLAGGCVRDRLRGEEPHDHDVATDALPERVRELFPQAMGVGESFGVMLVRHEGVTVEVATFRSDGTYQDGRRPQSIRYAGPLEDALRRDFTINGLFEDPRTGEIVDHVGGRTDLEDGVIRAIGDPAARLAEDRLRTLRAVRFAARFGYRIEPATEAAIVAAAPQLRGVSRERVGHELRRMLAEPSRSLAVGLIERLGLDLPIFEEGSSAGTRPRVAGLPATSGFEETLLGWLLDRRDAGRAGGDDGPESAVDLTAHWRRWCGLLVCSNAERAAGLAILRSLDGLREWATLGVASRKRLAAGAGFDAALKLLASLLPEVVDQRRRDVAALAESGLAPTPLLDGNDLIRELRLRPGPNFKGLLDRLYDAQLQGQISDRRAALTLARRLTEEIDGSPATGPHGFPERGH